MGALIPEQPSGLPSLTSCVWRGEEDRTHCYPTASPRFLSTYPFFPVEIVPSLREKAEYLRRHPADYLLFTGDRAFPVRMKDEIHYSDIILTTSAISTNS
jgi:hypothetical protein